MLLWKTGFFGARDFAGVGETGQFRVFSADARPDFGRPVWTAVGRLVARCLTCKDALALCETWDGNRVAA
jgi:hypothetical protein